MTDSGHELRENNEKIVKLMAILKKQREEINFLIEKQEMEKGRIRNDIEKLTFKLTLLTKSLNQRVQARNNYDKTIHEIEENYTSLVVESGKLLFSLNKEVQELEQIMDKRIGTPTNATDKPSPATGQARRPSSQSERSAGQRSQRDRPSSYAGPKERPSGQSNLNERLSKQEERPPSEEGERLSTQSSQKERGEKPSGQEEAPGEVQAEAAEKPIPIMIPVEKPSILSDKAQHDERSSVHTQRSERPSVQIFEKKERPSILLTMSEKRKLYSMETTEESEEDLPFKHLNDEGKFSVDGDRRGSASSKKSADDEDRNRPFIEENKYKRIPIGDKKTARIAEKEATVKRPTTTSEAFPFPQGNYLEETMNVPKMDPKDVASEEDSTKSLRQDCGKKNCSNKSLPTSTSTECSKKQCCGKSADGKKRCHKTANPEEHSSQSKPHWRSVSDSERKEIFIEEKSPHEHKTEHVTEMKVKKVKSSSGASDSDDSLPLNERDPLGRAQTKRVSETSEISQFDNIKQHSMYDDEVQSFREAYGRQHSQQPPSRTSSNRKNE